MKRLSFFLTSIFPALVFILIAVVINFAGKSYLRVFTSWIGDMPLPGSTDFYLKRPELAVLICGVLALICLVIPNLIKKHSPSREMEQVNSSIFNAAILLVAVCLLGSFVVAIAVPLLNMSF